MLLQIVTLHQYGDSSWKVRWWYPDEDEVEFIETERRQDGTLLVKTSRPGPWFNIKMPSYQYRKSHCGDKTVVRSSYLHNGISCTGKMTSLYWFSPLARANLYISPSKLVIRISAQVKSHLRTLELLLIRHAAQKTMFLMCVDQLISICTPLAKYGSILIDPLLKSWWMPL